MKTCGYCGQENENPAQHCTRCGQNQFDLPVLDLPLTRQEKDWIEDSLLWLIKEFGWDYFLKHPVILPEQSFFPDRYKATEECVNKVAQRVCSYMDVDFGQIEIYLFSEGEDMSSKYRLGRTESKEGAAGLYYHPTESQPRPIIAIKDNDLKNPTKLVATIAHELGHVILLGGGRISHEDKHHEYLTDLITVFLGLGIFTANSAFQFSQWQDHSHHGWQASRLGYLSEEMFAYALACYAWLRNESKPSWAKYLSMNVGAYFKRCHKYLLKGGETKLAALKT